MAQLDYKIERIKKDSSNIDYSKVVVNSMLTTVRNNLELTEIVKNKAIVLLGVTVVMLTFVVLINLIYSEWIRATSLYIPLIILSVTCSLAIYYAVMVLQRPNMSETWNKVFPNPFLFGSFHKKEVKADNDYLLCSLSSSFGSQKSSSLMSAQITQDLYHVRKRLECKMLWIQLAFNILTVGILLSMITSIIVLFFNS